MIATVLRQNLLTLASAYGRATRSTPAQVSKKFYGNVGFFEGFRHGDKTISIDKLDSVIDDFRANWPAGTPWPYLRAAIVSGPEKKKTVPKSA